MKYDVTYSCGHKGTVELYGKTSDREAKIRWYESSAVCPECYKKQQQEAADKTATEYELPELEGSEKQIAWANTIRCNYILNHKDLVDAMMDLINGRWEKFGVEAKAAKLGKTPEEIKEIAIANAKKQTVYTALTTTSAKWVIDNLRQ